MLKKTITYKDLDDNPVTEDFYFNLNKAEIAKMELGKAGGGLSEHLKRIVANNDGAGIIDTFEEILRKSYGIRGADNKSFDKSDEISTRFMQTDAYSVLFMELVTDATASAEFIRGIVPSDLGAQIEIPELPTELRVVKDTPLPQEASKEPETDPMKMSREELVQAMKAKNDERAGQ